MPSFSLNRFLRGLVVCGVSSAVWCAGAFAQAEPIAFKTLDNVAYSVSATVSPYAAKVFVAGQPASDGATALAGLERNLALLGLDRKNIAYVRASLTPRSDGTLDMDSWNTAWREFFAPAGHTPSRTTLAADALFGESGTSLQAEAVAAFFAPASASAPGKPSPFNPYIRLAGEGPFGSSGAAVVLPGSPMLFSAGVLADLADLTKPERTVERYGSVAEQSRSIFKKLEQSIAAQGFRWEDVFYVRALLSAVPGTTEVDFTGFGAEFEKAFMAKHPDLRPALALVTGPGFSSNGQLIEIEVYAAAADARGPFDGHDFAAAANPWLEMTGTAEAQISSTGTVARLRPVTWFAGAIGAAGGDMHDQGVTALLTLRNRLASAGLKPSDVVQLRAYPVVGEAFRKNIDLWNEAYGRFFNHAKLNPQKPARTSFPVSTLPQKALIEIEVIAVGR
ncbi:MAG: RidA family protein [Verrucomicrobia bacterium]|nr:RidA family protein [Verrucomicrobiota bacterium]